MNVLLPEKPAQAPGFKGCDAEALRILFQLFQKIEEMSKAPLAVHPEMMRDGPVKIELPPEARKEVPVKLELPPEARVERKGSLDQALFSYLKNNGQKR